jgi:hypothetical protein
MIYRIKKTTDLDGTVIFIPQFRRLFVYWDFWETSFPPHRVFYRTYELAEHFIKLQRAKPKDEFYLL